MSIAAGPEKAWFDAAFDPYVAIDTGGFVTEWNRAAAHLFGWTREEAVGRALGELIIPPRHRARHEAGMRRYRSSSESTVLNRRLNLAAITRSGDEIPVEITIWPDDAPGLTRFNAFLRDLRAENKAQLFGELHHAIVHGSRDAIMTKTLDGVITSWNLAAERVFGYTAAEAIGQPVTMLIPEARHAEEREILTRLARGEWIKQYETVRRTKDGRTLNVSLMISPLRGPDNEIVGASTIIRDLTERLRMVEELRAERAMLETINDVGRKLASNLELEPLLQAVTDAATRLAGAEFGAFFFNTVDDEGKIYQLVTLSGARREDFSHIGMPRATPLFAPTFDGTAASIRLDDVTRDDRYGRWAPHHGMPKGHLPVRSYLAIPVISRTGAVEGGLFFGHSRPGMFTERTEQMICGLAPHAAIAIDNARLFKEREKLLRSERDARAALERANASKDEFIATLSHELRTPLNAILGWAEVMQRTLGDVEKQRHGVEIIKRNARAQAQLISDLLDISRIVSGQMHFEMIDTMPIVAVQSAIDALRPAAEARRLHLEAILDPDAGPVTGDATRLQQVVWNLLSNAIKFTPEGGSITLRLERVNGDVAINVSDTGQGIEPSLLERIFDRYRQGDSSRTRLHGGLGLGLAISRHIVEQHNGQIRATSAGPGSGATFEVRLPLAVPARRELGQGDKARSAIPASFEADFTGLDVLVVDDEADSCQMLKLMLEGAGAQVRMAANAETALTLFQEQRPSLIVSDIGMPGIDGYELLRRLRVLQRGAPIRVPAIALTAYARTEDRTRALMAGFVAHVAKPIDVAEFAATVASVTNRIG